MLVKFQEVMFISQVEAAAVYMAAEVVLVEQECHQEQHQVVIQLLL